MTAHGFGRLAQVLPRSVVPLEVDGRPVRALLTDTPLVGDVLAAELQNVYL